MNCMGNTPLHDNYSFQVSVHSSLHKGMIGSKVNDTYDN